MLDLEKLKKSEVHVVGISGAEGSMLALFLSQIGVKNLIGHDFKSPADFKKSFFAYHDNLSLTQKKRLYERTLKACKNIHLKSGYLKGIEKANYIFTSSAWFRYPENKKLAVYPLYGWYNLLLEFFKGKLIGVSGTAGKGTVTNLIYQILKAAKKKVFLVGDSWHASDLNKIIKARKKAIVVAEVNNRVLTFARHSKKSPAICLLTNFLKHHLDDHNNSFSQYRKVKLELARYQDKDGVLFVNQDDPELKKISWPKGTKFFSLKDKLAFKIANPYFKNEHLLNDAIGAIKVSRLFKIEDAILEQVINNFKPRHGRFEPIRKYRGVTFINDSAATRPKATVFALKACPAGKTILILQGFRKQPQKVKDEYDRLIDAIKEIKVRQIYLNGQVAGYLYPLLKKATVNVTLTKNMTESVKRAWQLAKSGDAILLSPANESFGEFKDYRARSDQFVKLVNKIK